MAGCLQSPCILRTQPCGEDDAENAEHPALSAETRLSEGWLARPVPQSTAMSPTRFCTRGRDALSAPYIPPISGSQWSIGNCFRPRSMVGQLTLDQHIEVRFLGSEPTTYRKSGPNDERTWIDEGGRKSVTRFAKSVAGFAVAIGVVTMAIGIILLVGGAQGAPVNTAEAANVCGFSLGIWLLAGTAWSVADIAEKVTPVPKIQAEDHTVDKAA